MDTNSSIFNGNVTLDFSTAQWLENNITDWTPTGSTVFVVVSSDNTSPLEAESFFSNHNSASTNGAMQIDYDEAEDKFRFRLNDGASHPEYYFGDFEPNVSKLYTARRD